MAKCVMLIGPAGCGKSTFARRMSAENGYVIVSSDDIRAELFGDAADQQNPEKVFKLVHKRIRELLLADYNVIYDATNLLHKNRVKFLESIADIKCEKEAIVVVVPYDVCVGQNLSRDRQVPESVIYKHFTQIQLPFKEEGWDKISFTKEFYGKWYNIVKELDAMDGFDQDNPHHTLDLYSHCLGACYYVNDYTDGNWRLSAAALLHDIGKLYTKSRYKKNGELDDKSHYYGHESYGAYISLMISEKTDDGYDNFNDEEEYYIALLINYHMLPFVMNKKLWDRFNETFKEEILLLHEADLGAH